MTRTTTTAPPATDIVIVDATEAAWGWLAMAHAGAGPVGQQGEQVAGETGARTAGCGLVGRAALSIEVAPLGAPLWAWAFAVPAVRA